MTRPIAMSILFVLFELFLIIGIIAISVAGSDGWRFKPDDPAPPPGMGCQVEYAPACGGNCSYQTYVHGGSHPSDGWITVIRHGTCKIAPQGGCECR